MSQAQAAAARDRLPWLADDPVPVRPRRKRSGKREFVGWAIVGALLVAAISYWMGLGSWKEPAGRGSMQPGATVTVPQPRTFDEPRPAQPEITIKPAPEVSPVPVRDVAIAPPRADKRWIAHRSGQQLKQESESTVEIDEIIANEEAIDQSAKAALQLAKPIASPEEKPLTAWPSSQSLGAKGRIVRIGAFGTREQAKLGWRHMVRAFPALVHLKATVVSDRNSRGRHFYRFQIGTTSQAHSEVLCQRMEKIQFSCAVVGLSWKPEGVER